MDESSDHTFDPNLDPDLGQKVWVQFVMPNGGVFLRPAREVTDADWHGATEVDLFRDAAWEPMRDGGWLLYGTKENGQRLPINIIEGQGDFDIEGQGDFDVHYDPETGTGSVQAEYGDRPDPSDASAATPTERSALTNLVERVREFLGRHSKSHDQGMEL